MRKTQLLLDSPAECEQIGLLPRGGDDLHAKRLLIRASGCWQCEDREAHERDKGNGQVVDRRFEAYVVNPGHLTRDILSGKDRRGRRHKKILKREQLTKTAVDSGATPFGGQTILCREPAAHRRDVPNNGRSEFGPPNLQKCTIVRADF